MVASRAHALPPALRAVLAGLPVLTIALSGGLDSRFLCHAAALCGCHVKAVHVHGPHTSSSRDRDYARSWAESQGIACQEIQLNVLGNPAVRQNSQKRCYYCKRAIFEQILTVSRGVVCDGTNQDDCGEFRPGLQALRELGIRSPLAEAGLGKTEIRRLAGLTGLENPAQKARPCLLTRFAYGCAPTADQLACIEQVEQKLEAILPAEWGFRLRFVPEPVLHLDHAPGEYELQIRKVLEDAGCSCPVSLQENLSGYFDRI